MLKTLVATLTLLATTTLALAGAPTLQIGNRRYTKATIEKRVDAVHPGYRKTIAQEGPKTVRVTGSRGINPWDRIDLKLTRLNKAQISNNAAAGLETPQF